MNVFTVSKAIGSFTASIAFAHPNDRDLHSVTGRSPVAGVTISSGPTSIPASFRVAPTVVWAVRTCRSAPSDYDVTNTVSRRCACTTSSRLAPTASMTGSDGARTIRAVLASRNFSSSQNIASFPAPITHKTMPHKPFDQRCNAARQAIRTRACHVTIHSAVLSNFGVENGASRIQGGLFSLCVIAKRRQVY